MSTRCVVEIKNGSKKVTLYHHHDGYLEGVGYDLLKRFWLDEKGNFKDVKDNYQLSYLENVVNNLIKDKDDEYEFTNGIHTDIEYMYRIDIKTKTLIGYQVHYEYNEKDDKSELIIDNCYTMQEIKEAHEKQQQKYDNWKKRTKRVAFSYVDVTDKRYKLFKKISNLEPIIVNVYNFEDKYFSLLTNEEYEMINCRVVEYVIICLKDSEIGLY